MYMGLQAIIEMMFCNNISKNNQIIVNINYEKNYVTKSFIISSRYFFYGLYNNIKKK